MTATYETLARPASLGNAATAIFALLGLIDVALTASAPRGDRPQEDPGAGLPPRLADTWS